MLTKRIKCKKLHILAIVIAMLAATARGGAAGGNMTQRIAMATTTKAATTTTTTTLASSNTPATITNADASLSSSTGSTAFTPTVTATTTTATAMHEQQQQQHNEPANALAATTTTVTRKANNKTTPTVNTFNMPTTTITTTAMRTTSSLQLASKSRTDVADQQQQEQQQQHDEERRQWPSGGNEAQTQIKNANEQLNQPTTTTTTTTPTKLNDNNNKRLTESRTTSRMPSITESATELQMQLNGAKNPKNKKKTTNTNFATSSTAKPTITATTTTTRTTTQNNDMHMKGKLKNELNRIKLPEILNIHSPLTATATTTTTLTATAYDAQSRRRQSSTERVVNERREEEEAEEQARQLEHDETMANMKDGLHRVAVTPGRVNIVDLYPMKMEDFKPIIRDSNAKLLKERTIYESRYDTTNNDDNNSNNNDSKHNAFTDISDDNDNGEDVGVGVDLLASDKISLDIQQKQQQQQQPKQLQLQKLQNLLPNEVEIGQQQHHTITPHTSAQRQSDVMATTHKQIPNNHTPASVANAPGNSISDFTGKLLAEQDGVITEIEQKFRLSEFAGTSTTTTPSPPPPPSPPTSTPQSTPEQEQQQRPPIFNVNQRLLIGNAPGGVYDFIDRRVKKSFDFPLHHRTASDAMTVPHIDFANTKFSSGTKTNDRIDLDAAKTKAADGRNIAATGTQTGSGTHPEFSTTKFYNSKELYNEMLLHSKQQQQQQQQQLQKLTTTTSKLNSRSTTNIADFQDTTLTPATSTTTTTAGAAQTSSSTTTKATTTVPTTTTATTSAAALDSSSKFYRQNSLRRGDMWRANKMYTRPLLTTSTTTTRTTSTSTSTNPSTYSPSSSSTTTTTIMNNPNSKSTITTASSTAHIGNDNENSLRSSSSPLDNVNPQRVTNPTKSTSKPIARPRILTRLQEKINALECELQNVSADSHLWRGNETHELLLPIMTPVQCQSDAANCANTASFMSWEGEAEIQSGDILIVEINDALLNQHFKNITNSAHNTQVYQVTRSGHEHCDVTEGILLDITPLVVDGRKLVTLYDKDLTEGVNLLIVVSELWGSQCVRLKVTTKTDNCGENADCSGKGVCYSNTGMEEYECQCCSGFAGPHCEEIDACTPSPCTNNGICVDLSQGHEGNSYQCLCPYGYTGKNCQYETDPCNPTECLNGGTCVGNATHFRCDCTAGFAGPLCQHSLNECESSPCVHGICVDQEDGFRCFCQPGFAGELCNFEYNECESNPCQNGGECIDHIGSYECRCTKGYTGNRCQIKVDFCANKPCPEGHRCIDHGNDYSCECPEGHNGLDCNQMPRTQCNVNPCTHGGTCWSSGESFYCACRPGYTGTMCEDEFVVETVVSSSEFMVDDTSVRNFNDKTFGSPVVLKSPIELHNAYFAAGVLAAAIFIVAIVVTICHCKVNQTYRKFSTRSTSFFPILGFGRRPKAQNKLNKHWLSGKGLGSGNALRASSSTASLTARGHHLPPTTHTANGSQCHGAGTAASAAAGPNGGPLYERPFPRHLAMNLENDMYYTVDFSENSQHSPLIQ